MIKVEGKSRFLLYVLLYIVWLVMIFALTSGFADPQAWLSSWSQWDAEWYQRIWLDGYPRSDPRALVFPPGYSLIVGSIASFFGLGFHVAAILINSVTYFFAGVLISEVLSRQFRLSPISVFVFVLSSPAAYFIFSAYSDSLFCFILWLLLFLAVRCQPTRGRVILQTGLLLLAPWIRLTGYALASWLLLRRWRALAVLVSLLACFALNWQIAGDPLYFLKAQRLFFMPEGSILDGARYTFSGLVSFPGFDLAAFTPYMQFHLLPSLYFGAISASALWLALKREWLLLLTVIAVLLVSHNQSFWRSAVRYDLPVLPIIMVPVMSSFHLSTKSFRFLGRFIFICLIVVQFLLQIYFARLFKSGQWAF